MEVIGAPGAAEYFEKGLDPCFGKFFAKSLSECGNCLAPVIKNGKIHTLRELCEQVCQTGRMAAAGDVVRLTSKDVLDRVQRGVELPAIFAEILGKADPEHKGTAARQLLADRLSYLYTIGLERKELPGLKDLLKSIGR